MKMRSKVDEDDHQQHRRMRMRMKMTTSNTGEADQAELSPLSSPQAGALPSHHHLLFIINIGVRQFLEAAKEISRPAADLPHCVASP